MAVDQEPMVDKHYPPDRLLHSHQPAITRTSRTVRKETLPYFYGTRFVHDWNVLCDNWELLPLAKLFEMIGPENRRALRGVRIVDVWYEDTRVVENDMRKLNRWKFGFQLEHCGKSPSAGYESFVYEVKFL